MADIQIIEHGTRPASSFKGNPRNWRTHPENQREAVAASLRDLGWIAPVIENKRTGHLIDGHERVWQALQNGDEDVPYVLVDLSEQKEHLALTIFDPIGALADTDREVLSALIDDVKTGEAALQGLIEDMAEANDLLDMSGTGEPEDAPDAQPDRADELREKWGTETGQVWQIGQHRLMCGDCRTLDVWENTAKMVVTDPPYGVSYVGKTKDKLIISNDDLSGDELDCMIRDAFDRCESVSTDGAYWFATVPAGPLHIHFESDWLRRGILRQLMVWVKNSLVLGHSEYHYRHEGILFGWVPGPRRKNSDRTRDTVWEIDRPSRSTEHPTMKPVALFARAIKDCTDELDIVYDPFLGSGTTMVAAQQLGRICYGMEIEPKYVAVTLERMSDMGLTPELQP
jgi:DNA modification methylase